MQSLSTWFRAALLLAAGAFAQVAGAAFPDRPIQIVVPFAAGSPPGTWLYAGERPVLHLMETPFKEGHGGAIDHVAFEARGRAAIAARLDAAALPYTLVALPDGSAMQMFLNDPDGARIELVFRLAEDR